MHVFAPNCFFWIGPISLAWLSAPRCLFYMYQKFSVCTISYLVFFIRHSSS